jgi:hypothetical protein
MAKDFTYQLVNADHLTDEQRTEIEDGLYRGLYSCQQDFEKAIDMYHGINILPEANDEAYVTSIEIDGDEEYATVIVELDCSKVRL